MRRIEVGMHTRRSLARLVEWTLAMMVLPAIPLVPQSANRITQNAMSSAPVELIGSVHPAVQKATDFGPVTTSTEMNSLRLYIGLSPAQQQELNTLLSAQQDPKSPLYHQWLTQEEFGQRFGLSGADLSQITSWLMSQGFTVKDVAPSRNLITFSGTVAQVESAFRTQIHEYKLDGATHISNATTLSIPRAFSGVVTHIAGVNSFRPKPRAIVKRPGPRFTSDISGSHFLTPGDWATIYNVNAIYSAGYTGSGMHVGIAGQTYFPQTDIDKFRSAAGLNPTKLNYVCISTSNCTGTSGESVGDVAEANLDVEWSGGIAKDATVDYIYASAADLNQDVFDALLYGITTYKPADTNAVVPVFSMSYGSCETDILAYSSYRAGIDAYLQQAASQGQTIMISSGDAGAAGCDQGYTTSTRGAVADWPASSPYVTGVGGTRFSGDNSDTGADAYWNYSSTADIISSALQYIPETSWNDTASNQALSSSGGGVSMFYSLPTWQWAPSNYTGTSMRFVPDVAFSASAAHDGYLVCTQHFSSSTNPASSTGSTCVTGFRYSDTTLTVYGGTSAGSPSFAGLVTLLVQKVGNLGNLNPTLYDLASNSTTHASVFHDITTGDNKQPCTRGTGCSGGYVGYSATTGYDLVTGLGSIDGGALYNALALTPTTTTLSASSSSVTVGTSITLTAAVSPSAATGTVTFRVGSTSLGTATLNSGSAVLTVVANGTNGFANGSNTVRAIYDGDATYGISSGTTQVTVIFKSTTTAVSVSPSSVTAGDTVTLQAAVSPSTATGTATFKVGATTIGTATVSSGTATLSNVAVTTANGFSAGSDSITASYNGDGNFMGSSGSTTLTVVPTYTLSATPTSVSTTAGGSASVTLSLTSAAYTGTVTFAASVSSGAVSASAPSVTLTSGGSGSSTLTISTTTSAANYTPGMPWNIGGVVFFAVLLGAPLAARRKQVLVAMTLLGLMVACGGSGGSATKSPRTYTVTVTPTGSGTVTNPGSQTITVTVQ